MTWLQAAPYALLAAAVLLLPGAAVALAAGQRGLTALGAAPALSVLVVGTAALLAPAVGLPWGVAPVALVTAAAAVCAVTGSLLLDHLDGDRARAARGGGSRPPGAVHPGPGQVRWATAAGTAGVLIALVLAAAAVERGLGRPDAVSQTFDAMFHLNAVQRVVDTADASPGSVARLTSPFAQSPYYPAAWHAVAGLVAQAGAPATVAANALVLVVAGLVWPLGCVLLVRRLAGPRPLLLLLAGPLSQAFVAFPWLIYRWGALWPQALATALLPAVLAGVLHATCPAPRAAGPAAGPATGPASAGAPRAGTGHRWRSLLLALGGLGGCALAHPGSFLLGLLLLAVLVLVTSLPVALLPWRGARAQWWALAGALAGALAVAAVAAAVRPRLLGMATADWPATRSVGRAVVEELTSAPAGAAVNLVVPALVLTGLVAALLRPRWRWLAVGHVLLAALDVVAAGTDAPFAQVVTAPWYNDRYRLASTVPVTSVPLAVLGALVLAAAVARPLRRDRRVRAGVAVLAALAAAVPAVRGNGDQLALTNVRAERHPRLSLVDPDEQRFLADLRRHVPEGAVVAGTPWDGSAYAYALSGGVEVLYPHMRGNLGEDARYLADSLQDAATDPAVCPLLADRRVRYVLDMGRLWDPPGLDPAGYTAFRRFQDRPGFRLVASDDGARLYEITACDWESGRRVQP